MRPATILLAVLLIPAAILGSGCQRREEAPPPPPPPAPVSIWTGSDTGAIATLVVEAAARDPWTSQFRDRNSRPARIQVGTITDRSGKRVDTEALASAIVQALNASGGDKLAAGGDDADFAIRGGIGASDGVEDGRPVTFFAIDLAFIDIKSGEPVWPFSVERRVDGR